MEKVKKFLTRDKFKWKQIYCVEVPGKTYKLIWVATNDNDWRIILETYEGFRWYGREIPKVPADTKEEILDLLPIDLNGNDEIALRKFINYWQGKGAITKKNENEVWLSLLRWHAAATEKTKKTGDCNFYFDGGKITEPVGDPALVDDWKMVIQKMMSYEYGQKDPEDWNRWMEMWEQWEPER